MHELGIAVEIHRIGRRAMASCEGQLEAVRVAVGELNAVDPDLLRFAWEAVVKDGPDAAARLEVEWHPARQSCVECGQIEQRVEGSWLRLCPDCGMPLQVEGGRELDVTKVSWRTV